MSGERDLTSRAASAPANWLQKGEKRLGKENSDG
jgi:hypothetical protein